MRYAIFLIFSCTVGLPLISGAQTTLTLPGALHAARNNNPFLKPASLNTAIAQSDVVTARLRPNPVLNNQTLHLTDARQWAPDSRFYNGKNNQYWWQLTKQFQLAGQRKYKQQYAAGNVTVAEKAYADTERGVLTETGNKWLDVWYNKVNLELITEAKQNVDSLVKTQEIRLKNQVISSSELARTQLLLEQYQIEYQNAAQRYRNELQNLKLLTGQTDSLTIDDQDPVTSLEMTQQLDSLVSLSMAKRPDVQQAQATITTAKSNISLQRSLAIPSPELGFIWNPQNTVPYFGIFATIELPFFSRNQGEIKKSKILLQQSEQSLSALQQQVNTEVQSTWHTYQVNQETVEKYKNILPKAENILQSVRYAYTKGGTTIIDFLDAQRTWFDTQKMYYDALYNYRKSYLQLLQVTGLINQL
ncbi:outer membrane protein, cobalt-zinc-cadmium efflux system [Chitinophaga eiseniae]|uniref:Outer membrane protein, cobalt-zinc-cadmium efflux system n=1 Tax=Chitinophaga eiseniae TaxID=634771 RepID=A0A1T4MBV5_9BACT|nr:TolC family protein [Chitinophaga eiseniae]SJZ64337.1 outer membrane protein, cobalt-zinc-cadmium efflux system [Chitinophaga eiseniae]